MQIPALCSCHPSKQAISISNRVEAKGNLLTTSKCKKNNYKSHIDIYYLDVNKNWEPLCVANVFVTL